MRPNSPIWVASASIRAPLAALACLLLLAGCTDYGQRYQPPPLSYHDRPPLVLAGSDVTVVRDDRAHGAPSPLSAPLGDAAALLLQQRLRPGGGPGWARAVITEARITGEPVERGGGLFTRGAEERFRARLAARIEIYDERGLYRGHAATEVERTRTVIESRDPTRRDRALHDLVRLTVDDLDRGIEQSLRESLPAAFMPGSS